MRFRATFHGTRLHATGSVADDVIGQVLQLDFHQTCGEASLPGTCCVGLINHPEDRGHRFLADELIRLFSSSDAAG